MNTTQYLPEEELIERALEALGPVETIRFLNLPRARRLESVERHHRWQAGLDQESFLEQVFGPPTASVSE